MKNRITRDILYIILFAAVFFLIQPLIEAGCAFVYGLAKGLSFKTVLTGMAAGKYSELLTAFVVLSSLITIALYGTLKWSPISRTYLKTKPWGVLFWVVFLAFGTILPTEWIYEKIQLTMPEQTEQLFEGIMKQPWGYAAIGLLVPIAEEMVFRGGILRKLLDIFGQRWHWAAIAVSAILFGALHGNLAQGIHAFIIGLLLGWMYYRTKSIIPTVALHWVNNTVAYVLYNFYPNPDMTTADLFGSQQHVLMAVGFSLCILIPSLLQLNLRMQK